MYMSRSTKMGPGGNTTTNSNTSIFNKYTGQSGIGASSISNRHAKNRLANFCNPRCPPPPISTPPPPGPQTIVFTSDTIWPKPLGITHLEIIAIGGGGGGRCNAGGDGCIVTTSFTVNPNSVFNLAIAIGLGGDNATGGTFSSVINEQQNILVVAGGGGAGNGNGVFGGNAGNAGSRGGGPDGGYGGNGDGNGSGGEAGEGGTRGQNWSSGGGGGGYGGGGGGGGYGGGGSGSVQTSDGGGGGGSTSTGFNTTYSNPTSGPGLGGVPFGNKGKVTITYF
jgi:hypothetical protein